jgi:AraC family transcriptional regulator
MAQREDGLCETASRNDENQKHFLVGLHPGPPADHVWQTYGNYSLYTAEQHRSVWERHIHNCTQITVALSPAQVRGEWDGFAGRREKRELNGDIVWIVPPGVEHVIHFDRRASLIHLYLNDEFFCSMLEGAPLKTESNLVPSLLVRDPFLVEIARSLYREIKFNGNNRLYTQAVATLTATHLVRTYSDRRTPVPSHHGGLGPSRERKIRSYIEEHLGDDLSVEELAQFAEMSPNYLISLFRQSVGMTPHRYVIQRRVEKARELLEKSKLSLLEIGGQCGFQDQSQFTNTFRRYCGVTPGQYRRRM